MFYCILKKTTSKIHNNGCRCFYTAQTYGTVKKWKEAIALYEQVLKYANDAIKAYKDTKGNNSNMKVSSGTTLWTTMLISFLFFIHEVLPFK